MKYNPLESGLKLTEEEKLLNIDISQSHDKLLIGAEYNDVWDKDMTKHAISDVEMKSSAGEKLV